MANVIKSVGAKLLVDKAPLEASFHMIAASEFTPSSEDRTNANVVRMKRMME